MVPRHRTALDLLEDASLGSETLGGRPDIGECWKVELNGRIQEVVILDVSVTQNQDVRQVGRSAPGMVAVQTMGDPKWTYTVRLKDQKGILIDVWIDGDTKGRKLRAHDRD